MSSTQTFTEDDLLDLDEKGSPSLNRGTSAITGTSGLQGTPAGRKSKAQTLFEGWVWKRSPSGFAGIHKWQKRYAILTALSVTYFKEESAKFPKGSIPVDRIESVQWVAKNGRFDITQSNGTDSNGRVFVMKAKNDSEASDWVDQLNKAIQNHKATSTATQKEVEDRLKEEKRVAKEKKKEQEKMEAASHKIATKEGAEAAELRKVAQQEEERKKKEAEAQRRREREESQAGPDSAEEITTLQKVVFEQMIQSAKDHANVTVAEAALLSRFPRDTQVLRYLLLHVHPVPRTPGSKRKGGGTMGGPLVGRAQNMGASPSQVKDDTNRPSGSEARTPLSASSARDGSVSTNSNASSNGSTGSFSSTGGYTPSSTASMISLGGSTRELLVVPGTPTGGSASSSSAHSRRRSSASGLVEKVCIVTGCGKVVPRHIERGNQRIRENQNQYCEIHRHLALSVSVDDIDEAATSIMDLIESSDFSFIKSILHVLKSPNDLARGLAVRVLWIVFQLRGRAKTRANKGEKPLPKPTEKQELESSSVMADHFASYVKKYCSAKSVCWEIANSLLTLAQHPESEFVIDLERVETGILGKEWVNPIAVKALFYAIADSDFLIREQLCKEINTTLIENPANAEHMRSFPGWQLLILSLLHDIPLSRDAEELKDVDEIVVVNPGKALYSYVLNMLTLVHFDAFCNPKAKPFGVVTVQTIDWIIATAGQGQKTVALVRSMLSSLLGKIISSAQFIFTPNSYEQTAWVNLFTLTKIVKRFVFQTPDWEQKSATSPSATSLSSMSAADFEKLTWLLDNYNPNQPLMENFMNGTVYGLHWNMKDMPADTVLLDKTTKLLQSLKLDKFKAAEQPMLSPKDKDFLSNGKEEADFFQDCGLFCALLRKEQSSTLSGPIQKFLAAKTTEKRKEVFNSVGRQTIVK